MKSVIKVIAIITAIAILLGALFLFVRKKLQEEWGPSIITGLMVGSEIPHSKNDSEICEKYESYRLYEPHLNCLRLEDHKTEEFKITYHSPDGEQKQTAYVSFSEISEADNEQFVFAYMRDVPLLMYGRGETNGVLQNPDNYIDVFNDWTIDRIELLYCKNTSDESSKKTIIASEDENIIKDFKDCINSGKVEDDIKASNGYSSDMRYYYYVRVYFKESDNIYWETRVFRHFLGDNASLKGRYHIDVSRDVDSFIYHYEIESSMKNNETLSKWISDSIDGFVKNTYSKT